MSLLTARLQQRGATPGRHQKPPRNGRIAQLVEQLTLNQRVLGSSPSASTIYYTVEVITVFGFIEAKGTNDLDLGA